MAKEKKQKLKNKIRLSQKEKMSEPKRKKKIKNGIRFILLSQFSKPKCNILSTKVYLFFGLKMTAHGLFTNFFQTCIVDIAIFHKPKLKNKIKVSSHEACFTPFGSKAHSLGLLILSRGVCVKKTPEPNRHVVPLPPGLGPTTFASR